MSGIIQKKFNKVTALLPMKGHSERVPGKNLKDFNGEPLYHRIMKTLLNSSYIDKIIVNTDSEKIIDDIKNNFNLKKVIINIRPDEIIGDFISMNKIIEYDISKYQSDIYIQTHSTNPLIKQKTIDNALKYFIEVKNNKLNSHDSIFSVTKILSRLYDKSKKPINHNPDKLIRTQDLDPIYEENSCIYIFTKESFFENSKKRIGKNPEIFEIDSREAIDIDTEFDFKLAETISKLSLNEQI